MKLVIAEKPSVAKSIAEVLGAAEKKDGYIEGSGYLVSWCIGHLIELVSADTYREEWKKWSYETLPIIPSPWQYGVKTATRKQYQVIKKLLQSNDISEVICATDAGREGELIFRLVYEHVKCQKPIKRLWISSMEESAIRLGFHDLKEGREYDRLYQSALCRSQADWLVGINATRLFTVLYNHKLTVGRVQTPTLAMLVDREQRIADFKKEQYFLAHVLCDGIDAVTERINEKRRAEEIAGACQSGQALVVSVNKEEKTVNPPKLFDLTTLQREANRYFGFTAQQTLDYTQSLYEKKLVTYPRTDSQFLTEDMGQTAANIIGAVVSTLSEFSGLTYEPNIGRVLNSKKVSDHHAILPTMEIAKADLSKVPGGERQILSLIAEKLLCATGEKHRFETVKAELRCAGELFIATGKTLVESGWRAVEEQWKESCRAQEKQKEKE
ncbi:MAG: DNA topoisomerase, partial [Lachnospiraceae bacterium]